MCQGPLTLRGSVARWCIRNSDTQSLVKSCSRPTFLGAYAIFPGIEFVTVPALTVMGDGGQTGSRESGSTETGLTELVWTTPERVAILRESVGDWSEPQTTDTPTVGATLIVDSPFARRERTNESVPPGRARQTTSLSKTALNLSRFGQPMFLLMCRIETSSPNNSRTAPAVHRAKRLSLKSSRSLRARESFSAWWHWFWWPR